MRMRTFFWSLLTMCSLCITVAAGQTGQPDPWQTRMAEARARYVAKDYAEAEKLYLRALEEAGGVKSADPRVAETCLQLGIVYNAQKRYAQAERAFAHRLAICEELFGADSLQVFDAVISMANSFETNGHWNEAEASFRRAVAIRERYYGADHEQVAFALNSLARCLDGSKKWKEAEDAAMRAIAILSAKYGTNDSSLTTSYLMLGSIYSQQNRFAEAERAYLRCISVVKESADAKTQAYYRNALAGLYMQSARFAEAEGIYKTNLENLEQKCGTEGTELLPTLQGYATLLRLTGRRAEAAAVTPREWKR